MSQSKPIKFADMMQAIASNPKLAAMRVDYECKWIIFFDEEHESVEDASLALAIQNLEDGHTDTATLFAHDVADSLWLLMPRPILAYRGEEQDMSPVDKDKVVSIVTNADGTKDHITQGDFDLYDVLFDGADHEPD